MTLKQILNFDVNRVLQFDLNRILLWDIGRALTRPVTNPLLKAASGGLVGLMVFGVGSMLIGLSPSDGTIRLLALASAVVCAMTPNARSSERGENVNAEGPAS